LLRDAFEKRIIERVTQLYQHYKYPWARPSDEWLKVTLLSAQGDVTILLGESNCSLFWLSMVVGCTCVDVVGQAICMRKSFPFSGFRRKTQFLALIGAVVEV
jgi:hypothetical protein